MKYNIRLTVAHSYSGPVGTGRHLIRVFPADIPGRQTVTNRSLKIEPRPTEQYDFHDFFENFATMLVHDMSHSSMEITARAGVTCHDTRTAVLNIAPPLRMLASELAATQSVAPDAPHHFLGTSPRISRSKAMADYARACITPDMTTRDVVLAVGTALHKDLEFDTTATEVNTPTSEAFDLKRGVCQDFTHIMITCLRELGVPAGYVSGFLRTLPPEGQPRLEGADAMHAWVRAWCGIETGWMEYDPTNAVEPSQDHIVVAYGRDYSDISPIKGILKTAGPQLNMQAVDVVPA